MSSTTQGAHSAAGTDSGKSRVVAVQSRTDPYSFAIGVGPTPPTGAVDSQISNADLTMIWITQVEESSSDAATSTHARDYEVVKAVRDSAGIQSVDHFTADFTSAGGPTPSDMREQGPFYPLIDAYDPEFRAEHVENTMLIGRDPETGRSRFLISESNDSSDGQHIFMGNVVSDRTTKRRDLIGPIGLIAANSLFDPSKTKTNNTITIVDPIGLCDPSRPRMERRGGGVEMSQNLAERDTRRCIASMLQSAGWPTSDDDLMETVSTRVNFLTAEEARATPQGRKVTAHLEGDGVRSQYSH